MRIAGGPLGHRVEPPTPRRTRRTDTSQLEPRGLPPGRAPTRGAGSRTEPPAMSRSLCGPNASERTSFCGCGTVRGAPPSWGRSRMRPTKLFFRANHRASGLKVGSYQPVFSGCSGPPMTVAGEARMRTTGPRQRTSTAKRRASGVGQLEAAPHVRERSRRVAVDLGPPEGDELPRLGAQRLGPGLIAGGFAAPPEGARDAGHDERRGDDRARGQAPQAPPPLRLLRHRLREVLLERGERAFVPTPPQHELLERRARPQEVPRPSLLLPEVGRLLQLVPQDRPLLVLRLPPHQPRPRREQRLVHQLHAVAAPFPSFPSTS